MLPAAGRSEISIVMFMCSLEQLVKSVKLHHTVYTLRRRRLLLGYVVEVKYDSSRAVDAHEWKLGKHAVREHGILVIFRGNQS